MTHDLDFNSESPRELAAALARRFDVIRETIAVAGRPIELLHPRDADALLDEEAFERDDRIPYWAEVWPSSRVLAERVSGEIGGGNRLLELGGGVGVVAVAAALAGFDVLASDYYTEALAFSRVNAFCNHAAIATRIVDWRALPDDLGRFKFVVGADILYEQEYSSLVAAAMAATLEPAGIGLVADPRRRHAGTFVAECERRGLRLSSTTTTLVEGKTPCHVDLYELRWLQP